MRFNPPVVFVQLLDEFGNCSRLLEGSTLKLGVQQSNVKTLYITFSDKDHLENTAGSNDVFLQVNVSAKTIAWVMSQICHSL